jgi:hypothetical protein
VILAFTRQTACHDMKVRLFKGSNSSSQHSQLLFRLAKRLALSEFLVRQPLRKDIYAYINQLVKLLMQACD